MINGRTYVGQYTDVDKRFKSYFGGGKIMKQALKLYGRENFKKEIIIQGVFSQSLLDELETHYIQLYSPAATPNSYNISKGGSGGATGVESPNRKKIYQYTLQGELIKEWEHAGDITKELKLNARSIRHCASGNNLTNKGYIWLYDTNIEERMHQLNACPKPQIVYIHKDGMWHTFNSVANAEKFINIRPGLISRILKTKYRFKWRKGILISAIKFDEIPLKNISPFNKKMLQYTKDNQLIKEWDSINDIALEYNISPSAITNSIKRNTLSVGFIWQYA